MKTGRDSCLSLFGKTARTAPRSGIIRLQMSSYGFEKHDRLIRLMREVTLLQAYPRGLTTRELADRVEVSQRQVQRDIKALETEMGVPFIQQGKAGHWSRATSCRRSSSASAKRPRWS